MRFDAELEGIQKQLHRFGAVYDCQAFHFPLKLFLHNPLAISFVKGSFVKVLLKLVWIDTEFFEFCIGAIALLLSLIAFLDKLSWIFKQFSIWIENR